MRHGLNYEKVRDLGPTDSSFGWPKGSDERAGVEFDLDDEKA